MGSEEGGVYQTLEEFGLVTGMLIKCALSCATCSDYYYLRAEFSCVTINK